LEATPCRRSLLEQARASVAVVVAVVVAVSSEELEEVPLEGVAEVPLAVVAAVPQWGRLAPRPSCGGVYSP
jgi:hypothetical protein